MTTPISSEPTPRSNMLLVGLAASLPALLTPCACGLGAATTLDPMGAFEEAGASAYLTLFVAMAVVPVLMVLVALAGTGRRVPSVLAIGLACAPWITGVLGTQWSVGIVGGILDDVDASSRAVILARGVAEATTNELLGAAASSSLLAATALALSLVALAQPAVRRPALGLVLGGVLALPLLALAVLAVAACGVRIGLHMVVPALAALAACATAGAAAGGDVPRLPPHGRSAALAAAAPVAALLAVAAGARAAAVARPIELLRSMGLVDSNDRIAIVEHAGRDLAVADLLATFGWTIALVPAIAIAAWAAARARPSVGRVVGGALLGLAVLVVLGIDAAGLARVSSLLGSGAPWPDTFQAVALADGDLNVAEPLARVEADCVVPRHGAPIAASSPDALRALFEQQLRGPVGADVEEELPDWLEDLPEMDADPADPRQPVDAPVLGLAIDARVSAAVLAPVLHAASAAGARSVAFVGTAPVDPGALAAARESSPFFAMLSAPIRSRSVLLEASLPDGYADDDVSLWHATIRGRGDIVLEPRAGGGPSRTLEASVDRDERADGAIAYLAFDPAADAGAVADAVDRVARAGYRPLLLDGAEFPGHPETPLDPMAALAALMGDDLGDSFGFGGLGLSGTGGSGGTGDGTIGLGNLGTIGRSAGTGSGYGRGAGGLGGSTSPSPTIRLGAVDVRGSMSREVVLRVVRRHVNELRFCYEQELASRPALAGSVTLALTIAGSGSVSGVQAAESTLGNARVEGCMGLAARRWTFPAPDGGGLVLARVPIALSTAAE